MGRASLTPRSVPRVEPIEGEFGCYWVQSRTRLNMRHRVEMHAYGGNGACGCEDFEIHYRPKLEKGAAPSTALQCWHLRQAGEVSRIELWVAIVKHEDAEVRKARLERKRIREEREKEQERHAQHEDFAEIEAEAQGVVDAPPRVRREYVLRPAPTVPPQADPSQTRVKRSGR